MKLTIMKVLRQLPFAEEDKLHFCVSVQFPLHIKILNPIEYKSKHKLSTKVVNRVGRPFLAV